MPFPARRKAPRASPPAGLRKPAAASATTTRTAWSSACPGRDIEFGLSTARSRLNLANILDSASQKRIEVFVVGPPPTLDPAQNRRLGELNTAFADVTTRRKHLYVDTFSPLLNHEQWRQDLAANGGTPGQAGYGLMAWLVLHRGWFQWLGMDAPE